MKPCPFCGSTALVETQDENENVNDYEYYLHIACIGCGALGPIVRCNYDDLDPMTNTLKDNRLILAWNKRT